MNVRLVKEYRFEAAHRLTAVPDGHRCGLMHGHSYKVELTLEGPVDRKAGWLIDFGEVDAAWNLVQNKLDHAVLNDIIGNPTCELLTEWMWKQLIGPLPLLRRITIWETADARCEYEGD